VLAALAGALAGVVVAQDVPAPKPIPVASRYDAGTTLVYDVKVDARLTRRNVAPTPEEDLRSFFLTLDQTHEVTFSKPPPPAPGEKAPPATASLVKISVTRLVADAAMGFTRVRYDSRVAADAGKRGSSLVAPFTKAMDKPLELLVDPTSGSFLKGGERAGVGSDAAAGGHALEELMAASVEPLKPQSIAMGSTWKRFTREPLSGGATLVSTHDCVFSHPEFRLGWECLRIDYTTRRAVEGETKAASHALERTGGGGSFWFAVKEGFVVAQETWEDLAVTTTTGKFTYTEERRIESRLELTRARRADAGGK
jgi:hypothetical protein